MPKTIKFSNVPWSTVLKQSASMPATIRNKKRGIFLGFTRDGKYMKVVVEGSSTPGTYSQDFWDVDKDYMTDREKIAELKGRIYESNEPYDVEDYKNEIDTIQRKMKGSGNRTANIEKRLG